MKIYRGKMINKLCNHVYEICKKYNPSINDSSVTNCGICGTNFTAGERQQPSRLSIL